MHFQTGYLGRSLTHILVSVAAILQSQATKLLKLSLTKSYTIQATLYKKRPHKVKHWFHYVFSDRCAVSLQNFPIINLVLAEWQSNRTKYFNILCEPSLSATATQLHKVILNCLQNLGKLTDVKINKASVNIWLLKA